MSKSIKIILVPNLISILLLKVHFYFIFLVLCSIGTSLIFYSFKIINEYNSNSYDRFELNHPTKKYIIYEENKKTKLAYKWMFWWFNSELESDEEHILMFRYIDMYKKWKEENDKKHFKNTIKVLKNKRITKDDINNYDSSIGIR